MIKQILALLTLLFSTLFVQAQDTQFTGKVSNDKNEVLVGATVLVVETGRHVTTDADGRFVLNVEKGKKVEKEK